MPEAPDGMFALQQDSPDVRSEDAPKSAFGRAPLTGVLSKQAEQVADAHSALRVARFRQWNICCVGRLAALGGGVCLACAVLAGAQFTVGEAPRGQALLGDTLLPVSLGFLILLLTWLALRYAYRNELRDAEQRVALYLQRIPSLPVPARARLVVEATPLETSIQCLAGPSGPSLVFPSLKGAPAATGPADVLARRDDEPPPLAPGGWPSPRQQAILAGLERLTAARQALDKLRFTRRSLTVGSAIVATLLGLSLTSVLLALTVLALSQHGGVFDDVSRRLLLAGGALTLYLLLVAFDWRKRLRKLRHEVGAAEEEVRKQALQLVTAFPEASSSAHEILRW